MANYNYGGNFTYGSTLNEYGAATGYGNQTAPSGPSSTVYSYSSSYGASSAATPSESVQYGAYGAQVVVGGGGSSYEAVKGGSSTGSDRAQSAYGNYNTYPTASGDNPAFSSFSSRRGADGGRGGSVNRFSASAGGVGQSSHGGHSASDGHYGSLPSYSTNKSDASNNSYRNIAGKNAGSSTTLSASTPSAADHSGLHAAVYVAAASYLSERAGTKMSWKERYKVNGPPDAALWKYCELCKCSCAGPQAYKMHLDGRSHKKKEQMTASSGSAPSDGRGGGHLGSSLGAAYVCQLCDVPCSSYDAYTAHVRGAKHQKVLKLQIRMGKSIPEIEGVPASTVTVVGDVNKSKGVTIIKSGTSGRVSFIRTPKMTFIGGTQLHTTGTGVEEVKINSVLQELVASTAVIGPMKPTTTGGGAGGEMDAEDGEILDKNVQPVGLEYIEESMNATRTAAEFYCKLCECSFTDYQAKFMHSKGRRHRLQYKKKVDPSLKVDIKPSNSYAGQRYNRNAPKLSEPWRRKEHQTQLRIEAEELRYEKELLRWQIQKQYNRYDVPQLGSMLGGGAGRGGGRIEPLFQCESFNIRAVDKHPNSTDEKDLTAKHTDIYPNKQDLDAVQSTIGDCERALKLVSDYFSTKDAPVAATAVIKIEAEDGSEVAATTAAAAVTTAPTPAIVAAPERVLKGVMRVGCLANGLLLHGHLSLDVIVLCSTVPTRKLLREILYNLPVQLETFAKTTTYTITLSEDGQRIVMRRDTEPSTQCVITLTSPILNPQTADEEGGPLLCEDQLDRTICLDSLAALRHTKWFQAKAMSLQSCVIVIRILMDFCRRVPTWHNLSQWSVELLVEKAISSHDSGGPISPAAALMRVFEVIAAGTLLDGGPGLYDPCERTPTDVIAELMGSQEREDITNSAQHALRMIAFGQLRRVINLQTIVPVVVPLADPVSEQVATGASDAASATAATDPPCKRLKTDS